jgi:hypothetical protein
MHVSHGLEFLFKNIIGNNLFFSFVTMFWGSRLQTLKMKVGISLINLYWICCIKGVLLGFFCAFFQLGVIKPFFFRGIS